jgi:hypothetical protein
MGDSGTASHQIGIMHPFDAMRLSRWPLRSYVPRNPEVLINGAAATLNARCVCKAYRVPESNTLRPGTIGSHDRKSRPFSERAIRPGSLTLSSRSRKTLPNGCLSSPRWSGSRVYGGCGKGTGGRPSSLTARTWSSPGSETGGRYIDERDQAAGGNP